MSKISIVDLEVFYRIGVTEQERSAPQRLLICAEMEFDFSRASASDRVEDTINYFDVSQDLLRLGEGRSWNLLEKLAAEIGDLIVSKYKPQSVTVEVKKFPIPQARYVSVTVRR